MNIEKNNNNNDKSYLEKLVNEQKPRHFIIIRCPACKSRNTDVKPDKSMMICKKCKRVFLNQKIMRFPFSSGLLK